MAPDVDLIVNPHSGTASSRSPRAERLDFALDLLRRERAWEVRATESRSPADGAAAARRAVADAVPRVVVWGGDGTLNAVVEALAGTRTALAVVPGGSGNGFARALGLPLDAASALRLAAHGLPRPIDVGRVDGRPFINLAGLGLDAAIAQRFNLLAGATRGLPAYVRACLAEVGAGSQATFEIAVEGEPWFAGPADVIAVANGQQYGHGARIAPLARFDDGLLDVVVVPDVTPGRIGRHGWRLFTGSIARVPRVLTARGARIDIAVTGPVLMHRDGEVDAVTTPLVFSVQPRHLQVVAP